MAEKVSDIGIKTVKQLNELLVEFGENYTEAYFNIEKAVKMDGEGKIDNALPLYEIGLSLIDQALAIPIKEPSEPDFTWEKTLAMIQKLKKTRKEITLRIETLKPKSEFTPTELPPSYEDAVSKASLKLETVGISDNGNNSHLPGSSESDDLYISPSMVCDPLLLANLDINLEKNSQNNDLLQSQNELKIVENEDIIFSCNNVLLYFIAPDGRVSSTTEPNKLIFARIYDQTCRVLDQALSEIVSDLKRELCDKKKKKRHHYKSPRRKHHKKSKKNYESKDENSEERTFLQVGSFVYPLIPGVSPCTRSKEGIFVFPDISSNIKGAAIGIIVPHEVEDQFHEIFNSLLNEVKVSSRYRRSASISGTSKLLKGASYLASNIIRGAGSTAKYLDSSVPRFMDNMNPHSTPAEIDPSVQKAVEMAKVVTGKAVNVTEYLATKVGMATAALGRYLGPHIQNQSSKLLTSVTNMSELEATQTVGSAINTVTNAVEGVSIIYGGLETAANILAKSLSNNTVKIIEYKYGQNAGALTNNAIETVGNLYYTKNNFRVLKPKGFVKATLRGAGNAILEEKKNYTKQSESNFNNSQ